MAQEKINCINKEVDKWLDVSFVREVHHPEWVFNAVVVPIAGSKLRMYIETSEI